MWLDMRTRHQASGWTGRLAASLLDYRIAALVVLWQWCLYRSAERGNVFPKWLDLLYVKCCTEAASREAEETKKLAELCSCKVIYILFPSVQREHGSQVSWGVLFSSIMSCCYLLNYCIRTSLKTEFLAVCLHLAQTCRPDRTEKNERERHQVPFVCHSFWCHCKKATAMALKLYSAAASVLVDCCKKKENVQVHISCARIGTFLEKNRWGQGSRCSRMHLWECWAWLASSSIGTLALDFI